MIPAELKTLARRCHGRLAWRRFLASVQTWSPVLLPCCALLAWWLRPLSAGDITLLLLLMLAWLPLVWIRSWMQAPRDGQALAVLDRAAGEPDTFVSAWELAERSDDAWHQRHQQAAAARLPMIAGRLGELMTLPFPRQSLLVALALGLLLALPQLHRELVENEPERLDQDAAGELAKLLDARGDELARLGEQHPDARPALDELAKELEELRDQLMDESRERREVLADIDRQASAIEQAAGESDSQQRATDALIKALAKHVDTAGLADALERGEAAQVADAAQALAERLRNAGRNELARIAAALAEAASVAGDAEADAAVKEANEALARGDREAAAKALEKLGQRMQSQARQQELQQRLGSLADELRQAGQQALRSGQGLQQVGNQQGRSMASRALGANPFSRPNAGSLPAPSQGAMMADGRPMPGQGQPGQWGPMPGQTPIPGQMPGQGMMPGQGYGLGQGMIPVPGMTPGGLQAGWGTSDPGGGKAPDVNVPGNIWAQAQPDGSTPGQTREVAGELRPEQQARGGRELTVSALREAEAALTLEDLSPGRRRYLLRYFTALRSTIDEHISQPDPLGDPGALDAIP